MTFLIGFVLALLLLLTRTWQFAFLAGFVVGMLSPRAVRGFALGALCVGFAWTGYLAFLFVTYPAEALAGLVLGVLGLGAGLWWALPVLAVLLGVLVGGVGGIVGQTSARLFLWTESTMSAEPPKD